MTMQKVIVSSALIAALTIQGCAKPKSDPETNDCSLHNEEACTSSDYVSVCYWTKSGLCANKVNTAATCSEDAECMSGQCNLEKAADDTADTESSPDAAAATGTCAAAEHDSCKCTGAPDASIKGSPCPSECSSSLTCKEDKSDSSKSTCQINPDIAPLCDTDAECTYDKKLPACRRSKADDKDKNCRAPQVNGKYCELSADCASDHCDENVCKAKGPDPEPLDKQCESSTECTDDAKPVCRASKKGGEKSCQAKQTQEGAYCSGSGDCASGTCTDNKCAKSKSPVSDECSATKACSAGKFCINQLGGSKKCQASQNADDSFCKADSDCKNGDCDTSHPSGANGVCTSADTPVKDECSAASPCTGSAKLCLNTLSGTKCEATKHAAASYCKESSDCASGSCSSNRCLGAANDVCDAAANCSTAAKFCISQSTGGKKCEAQKNAEGKFCESTTDCAKGDCKAGVCTSADPVPKTDACTKTTEATVCKTAPKTHCINVSSGKMQCGSLQALNDFCKADADCASGLACDASKCKTKNEGHCSDAKPTDCQSNYCHGGVCKDKPIAPYAKCTTSATCQTDYECLGATGNQTCQLKVKKTRGQTCNVDADCASKRDTCSSVGGKNYCVAKCTTDGKTEIFDPRCDIKAPASQPQCQEGYSCTRVNVVIGNAIVDGDAGRLYDACRKPAAAAPKAAATIEHKPAAAEPKAPAAAKPKDEIVAKRA